MPNVIKPYRISIPANQELTMPLYADFFYCESATDQFEVESNAGDKFPMSAGKSFRGEVAGSEFTLRNDTGADIEAVIVAGSGDYKNDALSGEVSVIQVKKGSEREQGAAVVGVAAVQLFDESATRKQGVIFNNGTATIYLGNSGVTVANGIPVQPGGYFEDFSGCGAALFGISGSAGNDVRTMEVS